MKKNQYYLYFYLFIEDASEILEDPEFYGMNCEIDGVFDTPEQNEPVTSKSICR